MGLEEDIKRFIDPYQELLLGIRKFVNPLFINSLKGKALSAASTKRLEEKRKQFLDLFKQLPFPDGAVVVKGGYNFREYNETHTVWANVNNFCSDLIVYGLGYPNFSVHFTPYNKSFSPEYHHHRALLKDPIPGSTLLQDASISFNPAINLLWTFVDSQESRFYRATHHHRVGVVKSEHGLMEYDPDVGVGKFASMYSLAQKGKPKPMVFGVGVWSEPH